MPHKNISLNKMAATAMGIAYGVFLILLVCMDWYLIGDYQKSRRQGEEELLGSYAGQVGEDLEEINATFFDVFNNNRFFLALTGILTEEASYDNEYELDFSLKNRVTLEEWMHGYILYYNGNQKVRSYADTNRIEINDLRKFKEITAKMVEGDVSNWRWNFIEMDGHVYGMLLGKRGNASLCMLYNLDWIEENLQDEKDGRVIAYVYDKQILGDGEHSGQWGKELADRLGSTDNSYQRYVQGYYLYGHRVENTGLWICMATPLTLFTYLNIPQLLLLLFTIGSLLVALLLYRYMRREIILPLRELGVVMNRIRDGEWEAVVEHGARFEEIQKINEALGAMMTEIKKQKLLSYEQTIEKQRAQMQYLQIQLKPHFYLNSLKTLNVFALNGESGRMQDLIMHLSYHLRYLLQAEREMVPLAAEIDYVRNYEKLQEDMAGRRFVILWTVQEEMDEWTVPTLCIQTFVENSFKYAKLSSMQKELVIEISVSQLETEEGRFLDICVRDNGAGYPKKILNEINDEPVEGCVSVGINNLKRRCQILYQSWAEYDFYNDEGAVSELILPWMKVRI